MKVAVQATRMAMSELSLLSPAFSTASVRVSVRSDMAAMLQRGCYSFFTHATHGLPGPPRRDGMEPRRPLARAHRRGVERGRAAAGARAGRGAAGAVDRPG